MATSSTVPGSMTGSSNVPADTAGTLRRGSAGGLATLDGTGNVPAGQLGNAPGGGGSTFLQTPVATTTHSAVAGELVRADISSGSFAVNLPAAPPGGTQIVVKIVTNAAGNVNALTVTCGGSDVINKAGGATTMTLTLQGQAILLEYSTGIWAVAATDDAATQMATVRQGTYYLDSYTGTDDQKMTAALAAAVTAGGGIIALAARAHTFANQWATTYVSNQVTTAIIIKGAGVAFNGAWGAASAATTVTFTYSGSGTAMIDMQHNGTIEIYGIQFIQANLGIAFIQVTNAAPDIHNCVFTGGGNGATCQTDAILLGGTGTTTGAGDTAKFNAYQGNIHQNFFEGCRRLVFFQSAANACNVYNNTGSANCGSNLFQGAAFEMQGNPSKSCTGNTISGNCVEISGYAFGCKMSYAVQNTLGPNGFFDPVTAVYTAPYACDIHCTSNEFIDGYRPATTPFVIGAAASNNTYRTALRGAGINVIDNQTCFKPSGAALIPQVYGASGRGIAAVSNGGDQCGWAADAISVTNPYPALSAYTIAAAQFTDGSTVSGSNWVTSLTAAFAIADVGQSISGAGITTATVTEATYTTSTAPVWHASTAFNLGDIVRPAAANAHLYQVTVAGTSGTSAPTFPTGGGTVTDGGVTWTDIGASTAACMSNAATATATGVTISVARSTGTVVIGPSVGRGHFISRGTVAAPTVAIGAGLGTAPNGATAALAGFDAAHTLTLTTASTALPSGGLLATVTFAIAYNNAPRIVFAPSNAAAAGVAAAMYTTKATASYTFTAAASPALAVSTPYTFDVIIME